ncbi:MAG: hypothetical protein R3B93_22425 [Bacteroidia bacterium]
MIPITQTDFAGGIDGMFQSTNGGNTWNKADSLIYDMEKHPINPNVIYAFQVLSRRWEKELQQLFKSTNFGTPWTKLNTNLPTQNQAQRVELAISRSDPNCMYMPLPVT